jgi:hypothetical protein
LRSFSGMYLSVYECRQRLQRRHDVQKGREEYEHEDTSEVYDDREEEDDHHRLHLYLHAHILRCLSAHQP